MPIQLALVDDKPINRQTVKDKIAGYREIRLLLEAHDGLDFIEKIKASAVLPDVVLMDLEMPQMDGIRTIYEATALYPQIKFIVLTVFEDTDKIFEAIRAGASGYLLKEDSAVNIVDAITNVYEYNGIPMSPGIARKAMDILRQMPVHTHIETEDRSIIDEPGLSDREMDILRELISGRNYKFIGEKLFISPLTVRKHVANIYKKLHVSSRAEIINLAHKKKWI
ncbi:MAG: response regulator transcription factor [Bacteroidia bacterium]